jgi:hypothetical protein
MSGSAWMAEGEDDDETRVEVTIANATPGGAHPWQVQLGRCSGSRGVFGSAGTYEPLEIGNDGRATADATINEPFPTQGEYAVVIMASASNRNLIVACANLAPPIR